MCTIGSHKVLGKHRVFPPSHHIPQEYPDRKFSANKLVLQKLGPPLHLIAVFIHLSLKDVDDSTRSKQDLVRVACRNSDIVGDRSSDETGFAGTTGVPECYPVVHESLGEDLF